MSQNQGTAQYEQNGQTHVQTTSPREEHHDYTEAIEVLTSNQSVHSPNLYPQNTMSTQSNQSNAAIVGRSETLDWFDTMLDEQMAIRVHSKDVSGAFTIIEVDVPPFSGPPLHYHEDREEIFEVLEGRFRFHCARRV
ncbi:MAG: hypothetical protein KME47_02405 [Nodosilinea sp. WJT8-NPBG4]|jgi:mannose-6-phosphate isomerase-like protein (cupin superfamily)|nr:hypothetical protein [Nodosilinea sp. WJT8-NPBG4]